ncbi:unnamed protein product [Plutella xylostella]|uniref:(diamondback moth) hypothetical protein n=1 Tax=Plutella xylostella TaxID=51655 RepID=A0A8S4ELB8_PLUXY|nr:unnamed protein product [Plutella xylostella]
MTFLEDTLIILISQIVFFVGGWIFFVKQLFRDYEVHHLLVQLIFSVTFALSCTMFELIIFEIIGYLDSSSRYFHWNLGLYLLLFMLIVLIPFYIAYFSISNITFVSKNTIRPLTMFVWFIYLYFFWKIGDPFPILSPKQWLQVAVMRTAATPRYTASARGLNWTRGLPSRWSVMRFPPAQRMKSVSVRKAAQCRYAEGFGGLGDSARQGGRPKGRR